MNVKKIITILIAVGVLFTFAIVSTTPAMAAGKKKAEETMKKATEATKALPTGKININSASKEDLMMLPGIGDVKAEAIMKARKKLNFKSVDDLVGVPGIGEKTLEAIKPYLKFK